MKKYLFWTMCLSMICFLMMEKITLDASIKTIGVMNSLFRSQQLEESVLRQLKESEDVERGELAGKYFAMQMLPRRFSKIETYDYIDGQMAKGYFTFCNAIWNEIEYFPVAEDRRGKYTTTYMDTWNAGRTFGGDRSHEGTDIMASENVPGVYPIVSMTDGIVSHKGWLPLGGWRVGIINPSGAYFYYAHLDSYADIKVGDEIEAGDIIGFMGNSGYGEEGTTGKFATHLHMGIYIYPDGVETSVNPYWILKLAEEKKLFCSY